jgi:hypothetical protein
MKNDFIPKKDWCGNTCSIRKKGIKHNLNKRVRRQTQVTKAYRKVTQDIPREARKITSCCSHTGKKQKKKKEEK